LTGSLVDQQDALLEPLFRGYMWLATTITSGVPPATETDILPRSVITGYIFGAWFRVPFFLGAVAVYAYLRRRRPSEHLHCPKCDHILKGLTEPRCPECGERI
jgi:hypothetical protein